MVHKNHTAKYEKSKEVLIYSMCVYTYAYTFLDSISHHRVSDRMSTGKQTIEDNTS